MLKKDHFKGVWISLISPFNEQNNIEEKLVHALCDFIQKDNNITGIMPLGTIGENSYLSFDEKVFYLKTLTRNLGDLKVIPIIAEPDISSSLKLIRSIESLHIHGLAIIPPYINGTQTLENILKFYIEIFNNSKIPIFLYHFNQNHDLPLKSSLIKKLQKYQSFYGIIDSGNDLNYFKHIHNLFPQLSIFSGRDRNHLQSLQNGADGIVSWIGNAYPSIIYHLYYLFKENRQEEAHMLQNKLIGLRNIFTDHSIIEGLKYALYQNGFSSIISRLPKEQQFSVDEKSDLKSELAQYLKKADLLQFLSFSASKKINN